MSYEPFEVILVIPEPAEGSNHPGGIIPDGYSRQELVQLLRDHANNPDVIYFIADMLEE